jgi:hypothetical protein
VDLVSKTKNQHFISQCEQRLNSPNPEDTKKRRRIYEFEPVDRETPVLKLVDPAGTKIHESLSFEDLFSFHVVDRLRSNFEDLFGTYETDVAVRSRSLLTKLEAGITEGDEIKPEIVDLFAAKFQNFLRNPYSVRKVLNTVGPVADLVFTDPKAREEYERLVTGDKPQRDGVCKEFDLTPELYNQWLRVLFTLLYPEPEEIPNRFVRLIKGLFESNYTGIVIGHYPNGAPGDVCLLSDRGFNSQETEMGFTFEFNISSRAFASFMFCDPAKIPTIKESAPHLADAFRAKVVVKYAPGDLSELVKFNGRTVYQCARRVFAANEAPRVLI